MKFENTEVFNFEGAIRGMRNPLESWQKSDSEFGVKVRGTGKPIGKNSIVREFNDKQIEYSIIGKNDLELMQKLIRAGQPHRKFLRQILISVDIIAPLYWWKEFDTYKVGTVANSTSTMHKLASTPITKECFEMDDYEDIDIEVNGMVYSNTNSWNTQIAEYEYLRQKYNETREKKYWKALIRKLPESWLQKRTVTMNYENILNMVQYRINHKLDEWSNSFIEWANSLPYANELLFL